MSPRTLLWWRGRTLREQRLLIAMAALAAAVLAWLLVIRPLGDALAEARERHGEAVVRLAEARAGAAAIGRAEADAAPPLTMPIEALISQSATEAGFPVSRVERQGGNRAMLVLDSVRPQAFFAWVERLEQGQGLRVDAMSASTNSDSTLSVQVTFRARAS